MLKAFDHDYFKALLILMPGFITQRVYAYFATTTKLSDFEVVASALAFSIVSFAFAIGIWTLITRRADSGLICGGFVALLLGVSAGVGLALAKIDATGIIYRCIPVTSRVSNTSPWATTFRENERNWKAIVRVHVKDGNIYHGYPYYFSEEGDGKNQLFLRPAYVEQEDGTCMRVKGPGVFLLEAEIRTMEFLDVTGSKEYECPKRAQPLQQPKLKTGSADRSPP